MSDPFNCPKCGAHDWGLFAAAMLGCPHCMQAALTASEARLRQAEELLKTARSIYLAMDSKKGADGTVIKQWRADMHTYFYAASEPRQGET